MSKQDDPILVTIDISNVRHDIASMVREAVKDNVDEHLAAVVDKEVHAIAVEVVREKIRAAAEEAFATGWTKTDEYGRSVGQVKTVRDMILEHLNARDRYSSEGSWLERTLVATLRETIGKTIEPEISAAKKMFKEMLDSSIREKLALAVREAMGLK